MKRLRRLGSFVLGLLIAATGLEASARGDTATTITLADARLRARRAGPGVAASVGAQRVAEGRAVSAYGTFDTIFGAGLQARSSVTPGVRDSDFIAGLDRRLGGQLRAARALETGGSLSLSLGQQHTETSVATQGGTREGVTTFDSAASATLVHPLLRGVGTKSTLAARRAAEERVLAAVADVAGARTTAQLDVTVAYWQLAGSQEEQALRREATRIAVEQLERVRDLVVAGRAANGDVGAVERSVRLRRSDEAAATAEVVARGSELLRAMGAPVAELQTSEVRSGDPLPDPRPHPRSDVFAAALRRNPSLVALRAGIRASGQDLTYAENQRLPRLDLTATISSSGRDPLVGASTGQVLTARAPGYLFGLDLTIPLENRAARGAEEAARGEVERQTAELADREREVCASLVRALALERAASERFDLASSAIAFARESLSLEEERLRSGRSSASDVLLRQEELVETQLEAIRARVDAAISGAAIEALTGDLEPKRGALLRRPVDPRVKEVIG